MLNNEEVTARANSMEEVKVFDVKDNVPFVFVSYKSEDWRIVLDEIVRKMVNDYGLRVYYDANFDKDNELWCNNMLNAMKTKKCKGMLSFVSKNYMSSYACAMEILNTCSEDVSIMHKSSALPIIPIIIEQDVYDIGLIADEVSSNKVVMKEWKDYELILEDVLRNEGNSEEIKKTVSFLKKQNQNTTYEQLAMAMTTIIGEAHSRPYNKKIERWFNDLKDTISSTFSEDVFDKSIMNTCPQVENKKEINNTKEIIKNENLSKNDCNIKNKSSNIEMDDINRKEIRIILSEIVKELSAEGKDIYEINQKEGEPHFYTKRMDKYLSNDNKEKSGWGDDILYRYEIKTDKIVNGKIGVRFTPNSTGASSDMVNKMVDLHKLQCVSHEGANKNIDNDFLWGRVVLKYENINKNINRNELKGIIKNFVLYLLDIEQKIFDEKECKLVDKDNEKKSIIENNSKSFNSALTDEYINLHKNDVDILEKEHSTENLYVVFFDKFSPEKLKNLNGIDLLRKIFINDMGIQDNICSVLEYDKEYLQFGSIKGGTALKHCLYYSSKDKSWKVGRPPLDVKNVTEEEAIEVGTRIRDNIVKACDIIEKYKEILKTEQDYKKLFEEISKNCDNVHKIIFVKKYFHMIYKDLFPCMFSSGYIRKVAEVLQYEKNLDDSDYIGKIEEKKNQLHISNRVFAEIVYKYFYNEDI